MPHTKIILAKVEQILSKLNPLIQSEVDFAQRGETQSVAGTAEYNSGIHTAKEYKDEFRRAP